MTETKRAQIDAHLKLQGITLPKKLECERRAAIYRVLERDDDGASIAQLYVATMSRIQRHAQKGKSITPTDVQEAVYFAAAITLIKATTAPAMQEDKGLSRLVISPADRGFHDGLSGIPPQDSSVEYRASYRQAREFYSPED